MMGLTGCIFKSGCTFYFGYIFKLAQFMLHEPFIDKKKLTSQQVNKPIPSCSVHNF